MHSRIERCASILTFAPAKRHIALDLSGDYFLGPRCPDFGSGGSCRIYSNTTRHDGIRGS